jgi:hypothetical protein
MNFKDLHDERCGLKLIWLELQVHGELWFENYVKIQCYLNVRHFLIIWTTVSYLRRYMLRSIIQRVLVASAFVLKCNVLPLENCIRCCSDSVQQQMGAWYGHCHEILLGERHEVAPSRDFGRGTGRYHLYAYSSQISRISLRKIITLHSVIIFLKVILRRREKYADGHEWKSEYIL